MTHRFIDGLLSLLAALFGVFTAYFVGHALSAEHAGWAWITAAVLAILAALTTLLTVRRLRSQAPPH